MNDAEKRPFHQMLKATMDIYGKSLTKDAYHLWWSALSNVSLGQVREALSQHVKESPYFPKPSDVLERCKTKTIPPSHRLYKPMEAVSISDEEAAANLQILQDALNGTMKITGSGR